MNSYKNEECEDVTSVEKSKVVSRFQRSRDARSAMRTREDE
jgi:hypothetical protein